MKDEHRTLWNQQQKALQTALSHPESHPEASRLFLRHHAMLHTAAIRAGEPGEAEQIWSFDDEVWDGLTETAARRIPAGAEHSIAWMYWHMTRVEDITMNLLAAGQPQVFQREPWAERLRVTVCDTGSAQSPAEIDRLSQQIDLPTLRAYRLAVGRQTRANFGQMALNTLTQKVDPARIQRVLEEGAVLESARWLTDYWGGRTLAGLLLMPATRHIFVHLNEALRVKSKALRA